jgi:hypothetical protein
MPLLWKPEGERVRIVLDFGRLISRGHIRKKDGFFDPGV